MDLETDLLAVVSPERPDHVQGLADLFARLLDRHSLGQGVGPDLDAAAAQIVAELDKGLGSLDRVGNLPGVGVVEVLGAAHADECHRALSESLLDLRPLLRRKAGLDAMLVPGAEFDAQHLGLREIVEKRGQVEVLAPGVGDQAKLDVGLGLGGGQG